MRSKVEYVESSQFLITNYVRNSKGVGVLWVIFTFCYAIVNTVAFVTPEWIGDNSEVENPARFGLWSSCYFGDSSMENCRGKLDDIPKIPTTPFEIAAICGALSVSISLLTVFLLLLFFFRSSTSVFFLCGWMQIISGICLIAAVAIYPLGWDSPMIRRSCGPDANRYDLGDCGIKWAYLLAVIGCLDALVLASLAFILATKHIKLQPEPMYATNGSIYKGESNNGYAGDASMTGSRKSLNLHPVLLMPQPRIETDRFSELSNRTGRSKTSFYRPEYGSNIYNFQL